MLLVARLIYSFIDVKGFRSNKSSGFNGPFNAIFHGQASKLLVHPALCLVIPNCVPKIMSIFCPLFFLAKKQRYFFFQPLSDLI